MNQITQKQLVKYSTESQLSEAQLAFLKKRAPIRQIPDYFTGEVSIWIIEKEHAWIEAGDPNGPAIIFAHGLMGNMYNVTDFFRHFARKKYRMIFPFLPMYDLPLEDTKVSSLGTYLDQFTSALQLDKVVLLGNSTGGGASIYYASMRPPMLKGLILVGSSGISNRSLQNTSIRRNDWNFMNENMKNIVQVKAAVKAEMIDDVFQATKDYDMVIRILKLARSVMNEKLEEFAKRIQCPTLLCWGTEDIVTPPDGAVKLNELIPNSKLQWFENCGHLPQMEYPKTFCNHLEKFFHKINFLPY